MSKTMMNMESLEQVNGGNFFTDMIDYFVDKIKNRGKVKTQEEREQEILDQIRPKMLSTNTLPDVDTTWKKDPFTS